MAIQQLLGRYVLHRVYELYARVNTSFYLVVLALYLAIPFIIRLPVIPSITVACYKQSGNLNLFSHIMLKPTI